MIEGTKVLVIDDEKMLREMIDLVLTSEACSVTACSDGKEVIQYFRSGNYDVILTDLIMPGMSGIEVAERIREFDPYVPIALVSSNALDVANEAGRLGLICSLPSLSHLTN